MIRAVIQIFHYQDKSNGNAYYKAQYFNTSKSSYEHPLTVEVGGEMNAMNLLPKEIASTEILMFVSQVPSKRFDRMIVNHYEHEVQNAPKLIREHFGLV